MNLGLWVPRFFLFALLGGLLAGCATASPPSEPILLKTNVPAIDEKMEAFVWSPAHLDGSSKYIDDALAMADDLPGKGADGKVDPVLLRQKLRVFLIIEATVEKMLDPDFNPDDKPLLSVQLGTSAPQDVAQWREFQARTKANFIKSDYYNWELWMRQTVLHDLRFEILSFVSKSYHEANRDDREMLQLARAVGVSPSFQKDLAETFRDGDRPTL